MGHRFIITRLLDYLITCQGLLSVKKSLPFVEKEDMVYFT